MKEKPRPNIQPEVKSESEKIIDSVKKSFGSFGEWAYQKSRRGKLPNGDWRTF